MLWDVLESCPGQYVFEMGKILLNITSEMHLLSRLHILMAVLPIKNNLRHTVQKVIPEDFRAAISNTNLFL